MTPEEKRKLSYKLRGITSGDKQRLPQEEYIRKFRDVHGDKYEYPPDQIIGSTNKIRIICPEHGEFEQHSHQHRKGSGCQECRKLTFRYPKKAKYTPEERRRRKIQSNIRRRTSPEKLEQRFRDKFGDRFEYDFSTYTNVKTTMRMICPEHGDFWQQPFEHYTQNVNGCPSCAKSISNMEIDWLNDLGIQQRQKRIKIEGKSIKVDGYDPKTKTVYEFLGNFWHGHPREIQRRKTELNRVNKKTFDDLFQITEERFKNLSSLGYTVVYRWETDTIDRKFDGTLEW